MLEVKNLVKCYSTKGGVTVKALDDVSVKFPETGMVFLLGKSGSGKSTLLNVSGGLDKPDSGEIIVKGKSSLDFSSADFDSYRNTFVGFIFQEYNILNEFTVEQNVALALQLQNKPNDKKAVEELLERVDLAGLGKRKPNTLSGGQKQRVAIARALIKEPEIIMADEPTGALDSNTGKQVFDTLKKLSETKLVIVVSHDREFAEQYGDRIIELKDGQILSDVSKTYSEPMQMSENVQMISEDTISILNTEKITEADVKNIVKMLKSSNGEAIITTGKNELPDVKRACKINDSGNKEYFKETGDVDIKEYDGKKTKFIKSRLPMSHAVKMGASGLKTKPIRLIFTVLLSVVAFLMFGVVSTFMLYDSNYSVSEALKTADYPSITVKKYYSYLSQEYEVNNATGERTLKYEREHTRITRFGEQELKDKNANGVAKYAGIFDLTNDSYDKEGASGMNLSLIKGEGNYVPIEVESKVEDYYVVDEVFGFTDCGAPYMTDNGFTLISGKYPENAMEIAIPEYVANLFVNTKDSGITKVEQIVGKKVRISGCNAIGNSKEFTIVGVYGVGDIPTKYDQLKDSESTELSSSEKKNLIESLQDYLTLSYNTILYVSSDFYGEYEKNISSSGGVYVASTYVKGLDIESYELSHEVTEDQNRSFYTDKTVENYGKTFKFYSLDGTEKTFELKDNQVYVPKESVEREKASIINQAFNEMQSWDDFDSDAKQAIDSGDGFELYLTEDERKQLVNEWYETLSKKHFYYDMATNLVSFANGYQGTGFEDYKFGTEFENLVEKIRAYYHSSTESPSPEPTDNEWLTVYNVVDTLIKKDASVVGLQQIYYSILLEDMEYGKEIYTVINDLTGLEFYDVINQMGSGVLDDAQFSEIKTYVDNNYKSIVGKEVPTFAQRIKLDLSFTLNAYYKNYKGNAGELEVVGYYVAGSNDYNYIVTENFAKQYGKFETEGTSWIDVETTEYVEPTDAKYNYIIALTDNTQEQIAHALNGDGVVSYGLTNDVYSQLNMFLEMILDLQEAFLIVGIVFGVFAALMLLNFISVSISAKKKDIGILRAVGARGSDVFKIFFAEAFIIAAICFIIATVGAYILCNALNTSMVTIVNMKLLNFTAVNGALILLVSFGISLLATFFPVYMAAKKSPVESIRAL